ncbi:MAG TPA: hypothetical protein VFH43_09305 [Candidatus Kapabacteria bacterium]|nr:hypothetical protein [Candidatus Kapabacteria bacterium]
MRKSLALIAFLASIVLTTAFSAQAAEGVEYVGNGVTRLLKPTQTELNQSKLLITSSAIKHDGIEPLGQGKRKDTTSAGISRSAAEPKKNTSERPAPERAATLAEKPAERESKFGIYHTIKETVLDFLLPSRKESVKKIDLSKVQKDGRTERVSSKPQQVVR